MDYIDWIVSFMIFLFVTLTIIFAVPKFLPDSINKEEVYTSEMIFTELVDKLPTYKMFYENKTQPHIYFLLMQESHQQGRGNHNFYLKENLLFGKLKENASFFVFESDNLTSKTLIFQEKFLDQSLLKNFELKNGSITNFKGEAHATANTSIQTTQEFQSFYAEFVMEPRTTTVSFNHQNENNYYACEIENEKLKLFKKVSGTRTDIDEKNLNPETLEKEYINLIIKNDANNIFCEIDSIKVIDNQTKKNINSKITLSNEQDYFLSDFYLYHSDFLEITQIDNWSVKLSEELELYKIDSENNLYVVNNSQKIIKILFDKNFSYLENTNALVLEDAQQNLIAVGFPNLNEFIIVFEKNESYTIEKLENVNIDSNSQNHIYFKKDNNYYLFDIFNQNNQELECEITYPDENSFSVSCDEDAYVIVRVEENNKPITKFSYYLIDQEIITYEKLKEINTQDFINLYSRKQNLKIGELKYLGDLKLYENIANYLNEKGEEEIVKVLIKPN